MHIQITNILGGHFADNFPPVIKEAVIRLSGYAANGYSSIGMTERMLAHHTLLLGGIGMGKTNVIFKMTESLLGNMKQNDAMIIFDTKGDFYSAFGNHTDRVIANGLEYREVASVWNVFSEILVDGWKRSSYESRAREIATALFKDRGSKTQPFFANAARDIFAGILICLIRDAAPARSMNKLTNKQLVNFIRELRVNDLVSLFSRHNDMVSLLTYVGDGNNPQGLGVLSELFSMVNEYFQGMFAEESDTPLSMQSFVRDRGKKVLMIEYDLSVGQSIAPIYKLLIDFALKEALSRKEVDTGSVYIILDEMKLLPVLFHLEDALNFGRGYGVKVIAGLQSIFQLYDIYGENKGRVLAAGFTNLFAFHTNDAESRHYVSERLGSNFATIRYEDSGGRTYEKDREGHVVEEWDLNNLCIGDAIVALLDQSPFGFHFDYYEIG